MTIGVEEGEKIVRLKWIDKELITNIKLRKDLILFKKITFTYFIAIFCCIETKFDYEYFIPVTMFLKFSKRCQLIS